MKKQLITAASAVLLGTTLFAGAASAQSVKVQKVTLFCSSEKYKTTVSKIKSDNKLKSNTIYVGQTLKVNGTSSKR